MHITSSSAVIPTCWHDEILFLRNQEEFTGPGYVPMLAYIKATIDPYNTYPLIKNTFIFTSTLLFSQYINCKNIYWKENDMHKKILSATVKDIILTSL